MVIFDAQPQEGGCLVEAGIIGADHLAAAYNVVAQAVSRPTR